MPISPPAFPGSARSTRVALLLVAAAILLSGTTHAQEGWGDRARRAMQGARERVDGASRELQHRANDAYRRGASEAGRLQERAADGLQRRASEISRRYGPAVGAQVERLRQTVGDRAAEAVSDTVERYGPAAGRELAAAYERYGSATGERLRQAYQVHGSALAGRASGLMERLGPDVGQRVLDSADRLGASVGARVCEGYEEFGPAAGDRLRSAYERYGPEVGESVRGAMDRCGAAVARSALRAYENHSRDIANRLTRVYAEHGPAVGARVQLIAEKVGRAAQDPETQRRALAAAVTAAVMYERFEGDPKRLTKEAISLAAEQVLVQDGAGNTVSLNQYSKDWIVTQAPYLRGTTIAEDPAEVVTYVLVYQDVGYLVTDMRIVPTPDGDRCSLAEAALRASPTDVQQAVAALEAIESFEVLTDEEASAEDIIAAGAALERLPR